MFRTDRESKRTAPFKKGDKVVLRINTEGLSPARIIEAREVFSEVFEVMYYSFLHQNWICQDESGNQCQFDTNKIELWSEETHGNFKKEQEEKAFLEYQKHKLDNDTETEGA